MPDELHDLEYMAEQYRLHAANALSDLAVRFSSSKFSDDAVATGAELVKSPSQSAGHEIRRSPDRPALIGVGAVIIRSGTARKPVSQADLGSEADQIVRADARLQQNTQIKSQVRPGAPRDMRICLDTGLGRLPTDARERVVTAPLQAVDGQKKVECHANQVTAQTKAAHEDRPFTTALSAAGIGWLLGALLPPMRVEDDMLVAQRDRMMRDAEAVVHREIADLERRGIKAVAVGRDVVREESRSGSDAPSGTSFRSAAVIA